jgi:arsenate reductase (thioredoxin)
VTLAPGSRPRLLFVCVENAGRSQMAEAFARRVGFEASSAGTQPAVSVNPAVAAAMAEKAFNFAVKRPKMLTMEMIDSADLVITMGCSVEKVCPRPMLERMNKKLVDWNLEDPKGKQLPEVRKIRNEIEKRVDELAKGQLATSQD